MKTFTASLMCLTIAFAAGTAVAQDMKKPDPMTKDPMAKTMTMQECKDYMAMPKTDAMKKDEMMMKKDTMCGDMMKKDGMMKKDAMPMAAPADPMKK